MGSIARERERERETRERERDKREIKYEKRENKRIEQNTYRLLELLHHVQDLVVDREPGGMTHTVAPKLSHDLKIIVSDGEHSSPALALFRAHVPDRDRCIEM